MQTGKGQSVSCGSKNTCSNRDMQRLPQSNCYFLVINAVWRFNIVEFQDCVERAGRGLCCAVGQLPADFMDFVGSQCHWTDNLTEKIVVFNLL